MNPEYQLDNSLRSNGTRKMVTLESSYAYHYPLRMAQKLQYRNMLLLLVGATTTKGTTISLVMLFAVKEMI